MTKVLLDNCYHMITVDLQYRRVIELSDAFIKKNSRTAPVPVEYLKQA